MVSDEVTEITTKTGVKVLILILLEDGFWFEKGETILLNPVKS